MSARQLVSRAAVCAALLVAVTAGGAGTAGAAPAKERSAATDEECARFSNLRDALDQVGERPTRAQMFAVIDRAARAFTRLADDPPPEIADEMELLAGSFADLDDELDALRGRLRKTNSATTYEEMVGPIQAAFDAWAKRQDEEALGATQARVQEWLAAECGFLLGTGGSADDTTTTAACTSADEARESLFDAWKAGDRDAASRCATGEAVTELFDLPSAVEMTFEGCVGVDSNTADCTYRYEGGSLTMTVSRVDDGWQVSRISGRPD